MYCCYVLSSPEGRATYCGSTNCLDRRLRQHNGELKGGARYTTRRACTWKPVIVVSGFPNRSQMLSFEWHVKRATYVAGKPVWRRTQQVLQTLLHEHRWWQRYPPSATEIVVQLFTSEHHPPSPQATGLPFVLRFVCSSVAAVPTGPSPQITQDAVGRDSGLPADGGVAPESLPQDDHRVEDRDANTG
jgi:predicted GIY-YIG superfamily endonuclease